MNENFFSGKIVSKRNLGIKEAFFTVVSNSMSRI